MKGYSKNFKNTGSDPGVSGVEAMRACESTLYAFCGKSQ